MSKYSYKYLLINPLFIDEGNNLNMNNILSKTLGGLPPGAYARHFILSLIFPAFFLFINKQSGWHPPHEDIMYFILTLLYPYSRYVYGALAEFVTGGTTFLMPVWLLLFWKIFTMGICWTAALVIAPVGLILLYIRNSQVESMNNVEKIFHNDK